VKAGGKIVDFAGPGANHDRDGHVSDRSNSEWITAALGRYEQPLVRYATWILRDAETAREVVQETFLRLCRQAEPARITGHLGQWLYTVCRNLAFDVRAKESRMTPLDDKDIGMDSGLHQRETAGEIFRMLNTLPKNQREVVYLKFQCDLSYKEISEITKLSVGNVGFLIHTALKSLRKQILAEPARRTQ
jgi:RNA polymerase sigma-70 factor (ECF subfamily)